MAHELTFEQIQKCKTAFDENKQKDEVNKENAKMPVVHIQKAMKELHFEMSNQEIEGIIHDLGIQGANIEDIDFPTFWRIAAIKYKQTDFMSLWEESFKAFDKGGKEYLSYSELKTIWTDYGPKLTGDAADAELKEIVDDKSKFKYKEFVNKNF